MADTPPADFASPDALVAAAFDHQPFAALVIGRDGLIAAANQIAVRRFGGGPAAGAVSVSLTGRALGEVFAGDQTRLMGDVRAGASGVPVHVAVRPADAAALAATGPERLTLMVTPLRTEGCRSRAFLLTEDLGRSGKTGFERLALEQWAERETAGAERRRALLLSYRRLEEFSRVVAHDLRAPLRHIETLLGYLQEDHAADLPDDAADLIGSATAAAHRLQGLITDMLTHARSGMIGLQRKPVVLAAVVQDVLDSMATSIDAAGARIEIDPALGAVKADEGLVRQLIANLIDNTVKYRSSERSLDIRIAALEAPDAGFEVRDNGIGFDNAYGERLFEPFYRLHRSGLIEGTGVGLAICQTICERHGWQISAKGDPGRGAVFRVVWPTGENQAPVRDAA